MSAAHCAAKRLTHQAATVDVLKAISASPGDPQPVSDLIAAQAVALCGGPTVSLFEFDGDMIHCRAAIYQGWPPEVAAAYIASFPRPADQEPNLALAISIREARIVHIRDADTSRAISAAAVRAGLRSGIIVPVLQDGRAIGAMSLGRIETGGYSDPQVKLLQTFAERASLRGGKRVLNGSRRRRVPGRRRPSRCRPPPPRFSKA